jgi:ribosomal protein S18 acetylase RimI-like enzyme
VQTTNSKRFRRAVASDQQELVDLMLAFSVEVDSPLSQSHIETALKPLLLDPSLGEVWIAQDQKLIGYLVMSWGWGIESGGREALIDEVYVAPEARGRKVASDLVQEALKSAREKHTKAVFLETEADNPRSRLIYERLGFESESSVWMRRKL